MEAAKAQNWSVEQQEKKNHFINTLFPIISDFEQIMTRIL
jgi:hypothetical protein